MSANFLEILTIGGKRNTLGRAEEVVRSVLEDKSRIEELYQCMYDDDAWVRMRAIDSLEKICRSHPEWLVPYIDRLVTDFSDNPQPSIQWHLAELFAQMQLDDTQRQKAIKIMVRNISDLNVDWIVAANCMTALAGFVQKGFVPKVQLIPLLQLQQGHHSKAVVRRATKLLDSLEAKDDNKKFAN